MMNELTAGMLGCFYSVMKGLGCMVCGFYHSVFCFDCYMAYCFGYTGYRLDGAVEHFFAKYGGAPEMISGPLSPAF